MLGDEPSQELDKTTKAHNCILVNGIGRKRTASGQPDRFTDWGHEENKSFYLRLDLREAYPMLEFYERSFALTEKELIVRDRIRAKEGCEISWLLHMLDRPALQEDGTLVLEHAGQRAVVIPDSSFIGKPEISDRFGTEVNEGVDEAFWVSMPKAVPCDIPDGDPKGASDRGQDPDRIKDSVRKGSEKIQDCSLCLENKNKTKFLLYKMIESDIVKILAA